MISISLYVHFPFCQKRCRYCDFVSYPLTSRTEHQAYLALLQRELSLQMEKNVLQGRELLTVYFGGGTPSLFEAGDFALFLEEAKKFFPFRDLPEITIEINPEGFDIEKLTAFKKIGINRVSVGVQSFDHWRLNILGRWVSLHFLTDLFAEVRKTFSSWSIDLMYGLPGESLDLWQRELEQALEFDPPHLSIYNLTLHPSVPLYAFWKKHPRLFPSPEFEALVWEWIVRRLKKEGYHHYEVSNFARPGFECHHNLRYWNNDEYLGLGVSAWSYISGKRRKNTSSLKNYRQRLAKGELPIVFEESLSPSRKLGEKIVLSLRKNEGIPREFLYAWGKIERKEKHRIIERLIQEGWLVEVDGYLRLSPKGFLLANQVCAELIDSA